MIGFLVLAYCRLTFSYFLVNRVMTTENRQIR
jgi:hypothetical protein